MHLFQLPRPLLPIPVQCLLRLARGERPLILPSEWGKLWAIAIKCLGVWAREHSEEF